MQIGRSTDLRHGHIWGRIWASVTDRLMERESENMSQTINKTTLFHKFTHGMSCAELGFTVINAIEREDGSNWNYNITGYRPDGRCETIFVRTFVITTPMVSGMATR